MSRTFAIVGPGEIVRIADAPPLEVGLELGEPPLTADRLTDVTADGLWRPSLRLFPRGRAWPDESIEGIGAFIWHGLARMVAETMAQVHDWLNRARYGAFVTQCRPEFVEDHEREHGLPDACLAAVTDLATRRGLVLDAKTPPDTASGREIAFILRRAGFDVTLAEPFGFEFGVSEFGGPDGFASPHLQHIFLYTGPGLTLDWLAFGESGFGHIGFGELSDTGLTCLIERIRPAHTLGLLDLENS
ncbi:hypothetical protein [Bosea vestrisii]|uniref:Uncharacterized protein n=1 Tax=Bosea vestrisii TaxID=151416 RepID=A0ABW0H331_9HYPH